MASFKYTPGPPAKDWPVMNCAGSSRWLNDAGVRTSTAQPDKLREEAKRLGLTPEDLARAALVDLLGTPDTEFRAAAVRILQRNQELYKPLA